MLLWVQVTPNEDYEVIAEKLVPGGAADVRDAVHEVEETLQHYQIIRLMDPNMGASPSGAVRDVTWQMEFDNVGLHFDLASDSDVGRARLNDMLKPDARFLRPRLVIDPSCTTCIFQMKRYVWADHHNPDAQDLKQVPLAKNDDFPTLLKYLMNRQPVYGATSDNTVYHRDRGQTGYAVKTPRGLHANQYAQR
jgi:hypothetical protein